MNLGDVHLKSNKPVILHSVGFVLACFLSACAAADRIAAIMAEPSNDIAVVFENVGISEGVFETDAVGPSAFFVDDNGNIYLLDRVNGRLLYRANGSDETASILLTQLISDPAPDVLDFELIENTFFFLTTDGVRKAPSPWTPQDEIIFESATSDNDFSRVDSAFRRSGYLAAQPTEEEIIFESAGGLCDGRLWSEISSLSWRDTMRAPVGIGEYTVQFARAADDVLTLTVWESDSEVGIKATPVAVNGVIASAFVVGVDREGAVFVLIESVRDGGAIAVAASVYKFVRRISPEPLYVATERFDVPLADYRTLPARYVRVNSRGAVYIIRNRDGKDVWVERVPGKTILALAPGAVADEDGDLPEDFLERTRPQDEIFFESTVEEGVTREEILRRAEAMVSVEWFYNEASAATPDGQDAQCQRRNGSAWRRPGRLSGKEEVSVSALPYRWGGWDTIESFVAASNKSAGDTCTCRDASLNYCVVSNAKGVDCSGFITRVWMNAPSVKLGTTTIPSVSKQKDWRDLQCGDVLNRKGKHVRLFSRFTPEYGGLIEFYESSLDCGGACKRFAPMAAFRGYTARKYDNIIEE